MKHNLTVSIKIIPVRFFDPAIPLLGIYPTYTPAYVQKWYMYNVAQCRIFVTVKPGNNLAYKAHQWAS